MTVNERFFSLLKSAKCTQKNFCDKTGISPVTLSAWKKRSTDPPSKDLIAIADFFNVSVEYLLTGEVDLAHSNLNDDERELLNNYRLVDSRVKHKIHTIIYDELDQMKSG